MKRIVFLILFIVLFIPVNVFALEFDTYSKNVLLYNLNDNSILYEKNSDDKVSIASITKVMTAIVVLENVDNLNDKVTLIKEDFDGLYEANASVAGFDIGEEVTYKDLLCGLLIPSGADAAQALSRLVGGDFDKFVTLMNKKAKELGMKNTSFANTTGLDDPNNYSSLKDVYIMFSYALKNKDFLEIIKMRRYTTSDGLHTFKNTIQKMIDVYGIEDVDYLVGGKTGSTGDAGLCLASLAVKDDVSYILITTGAPFSRERAYTLEDAKKVYEYFMNNYSYKNIVEKGDELVTLKTLYGKKDNITFKAKSNISKYLENEIVKDKLKYKYKGKDIVSYKMNKGDKLGVVEIYFEDRLLDSVDVVLDKKIEFSLYKYLVNHKAIVIGVFSSIIILIFLFTRRKR